MSMENSDRVGNGIPLITPSAAYAIIGSLRGPDGDRVPVIGWRSELSQSSVDYIITQDGKAWSLVAHHLPQSE